MRVLREEQPLQPRSRVSTCAFSNGFDSGFQICTDEEAGPDTRYLRGVPSAIPRIRKRPDVTDISGVGYIGVIGAGSLTGEAALEGELTQAVDLFGRLVRETFRFLVGEIRDGAEALLVVERCLEASMAVAFTGYGATVGEQTVSGVGAQAFQVYAQIMRDQRVEGRARIAVGGEAAIVAQENDEPLILAAAMMIMRRLRR